MQVLIDECLPKKLKKEFEDHQVSTVPENGWAGVKNGELLKLAQENQFDFFITADQGISFQQNLSETKIAVIVLAAPDNRLETLLPLLPKVHQAMAEIQPSEIRIVSLEN